MKFISLVIALVLPVALLAWVAIAGTAPMTLRVFAAIYVFLALLAMAVNSTRTEQDQENTS